MVNINISIASLFWCFFPSLLLICVLLFRRCRPLSPRFFVFSNASLEAAAVLTGHTNSVSAVHAAGSAAFTGDWDGHVCMWDIACIAADNAVDRGVSNQVRGF